MASLIEQLLGGSVVQRREAPQSNDLGQLLGFLSSTSQMQPVQAPQHQGGNVDIGSLMGLINSYRSNKSDSVAQNYLKSILGTKGQERIPTPYKNAQNAIPGSGILGGNALEIANLLTQSPDPTQQQKGLDILKFNAEQQLKASTDNSTPYYTPVETTQGVQAFNNRTGQFTLGIDPSTGKPFIKPGSSPDFQYQLHKSQKAGSEAGTVREVPTEDGRTELLQGSPENNFGNLRPPGKSTGYQTFNTPEEGIKALNNQLSLYGKRGINTISDLMKVYSPSGDGANDPTKAAKNVAGFIGGGVTPNTKVDFTNPVVQHMVSAGLMRQEGNIRNVFGQSSAEKKAIDVNSALQTEQGKNQLDVQKAADTDKAAAIMSAKKSLPLYEKAIELLPTAVNGGADSAVNSALNYLGVPTEKSKAQGTLETVSNELTASIKKAPGSQSDKELIFAQKQAGDLANTSLPVETRMAAAQYLKERNIKILAGESVQDPPEQSKTNVIKYDSQGNRIR
jgi:hypothetical protein